MTTPFYCAECGTTRTDCYLFELATGADNAYCCEADTQDQAEESEAAK